MISFIMRSSEVLSGSKYQCLVIIPHFLNAILRAARCKPQRRSTLHHTDVVAHFPSKDFPLFFTKSSCSEEKTERMRRVHRLSDGYRNS